MMLLILLGVMATVSMTTCLPEDYTRFDSIDTDEILSNDRLVKAYIQCFMDEGKCTPEGEDMKRSVPKAINNSCDGCTEFEKVRLAKVMKVARDKHSSSYKKLAEKYLKNKDISIADDFIQQYAP